MASKSRSPVWFEKWFNTDFVTPPEGSVSHSVFKNVKVKRAVAPLSKKNPAQPVGGEIKRKEVDHYEGKYIYVGKKEES